MTAIAPAVTPGFIGIVLGAGDGQRMGGPKALLAVRWGEGPGELPLAILHARSMLYGGAERVVIVTRAPVARELGRFAERGIDIVASNAEGSLGPAGSLAVALRYLGASTASVRGARGQLYLITPVDTPPSTTAIRTALVDAMVANPTALAARPVLEGRRGHPVLVAASALEPMQEAEPPPLRDLLRDLGERVLDVPVVDARTTVDFDAPEDVERWYGTKVRFFSSDEA
jgi:molybdenum cofactor cytidylyltransferase